VADRAFSPRFAVNTQGDIAIASNSMMTCVDDPGGVCSRARAATGGAIAANNNNARTMTWIDADADLTTFDSSSAVLSRLAPGRAVRYRVMTTTATGQPARRFTNTATVRGANVARRSASASVAVMAAPRPPFTG
jgi:hypothetical protein